MRKVEEKENEAGKVGRTEVGRVRRWQAEIADSRGTEKLLFT
jgi:hypothetical protein